MTAAPDLENGPSHWVFGYGSLIWHPGFPFVGKAEALLKGAHRSLCLYSHRHRGTAERPGLVFGLVRGGSCRGMAFEVAGADWPEVREYLRRREQVTSAYKPAMRPLRLSGDRRVSALTFVVDETHVQFAGRLSLAEQLNIVRGAHGESGPNSEYVIKTVQHLLEMGIRDPQLVELAQLLEAFHVPA